MVSRNALAPSFPIYHGYLCTLKTLENGILMGFIAKKNKSVRHRKIGVGTLKLMANRITLTPNTNKEGFHESGCTHVAFGMCHSSLMAWP